MMIKKSLLEEIQIKLEDVVDLMKMDWELFSEHVVHHVEQQRRQKKQQ